MIKEAKRFDLKITDMEATFRKAIFAWDHSTWSGESVWRHYSLAALDKATKQFRSYSKAQCDFEATAAAGGNGAGDMRLECQIELDKQYLGLLHKEIALFPPGGG